MVDPTLSQILTLDRSLQATALEIINRARTELQLPAVIVKNGARRTLATQRSLQGLGVTTTLNSKHLRGLAFDIDMWGWNRNDVPTWAYDQLAELAKEYGLKWGGDWSTFRDIGHFEV